MPGGTAAGATRRRALPPLQSCGCATPCRSPARNQSIYCSARRFPGRSSSLRERYHVGKELVEAPFELGAGIGEVMRRGLEMRPPRKTLRKVRERDVDAFDFAIREDPALHVRIDGGQPPRLRMGIHRLECAIDESLERLI